MSEKQFMIFHTIILLILIINGTLKFKKNINSKVSIFYAIYGILIFIFWILYCLYRLPLIQIP